MRPVRLYRSTPFRLALAFGVLFVLGFLVSGLVTYQFLKRELMATLDTSVAEMYSVTTSNYAPNDMEDLVSAIEAYGKHPAPDARIFSLVDGAGRRIAGNITAPKLPDGLSSITAWDIGIADDTVFRVFSGAVGPNRLTVGRSLSETDDFEDIAVLSFGWSALLTIIFAAVGGIILATRAQKRLDGVVDTMVDISNGHMQARIPVSGRRDDIDLLSIRINDALERLSRLVESMRQVSADIAHDLKTPLNRLKITIEDAIERNEKGKPVGDLLADAFWESDQINATFDALLRISQIEAGGRKVRFRSVDLVDVMAEVAEIYADVAEDNGQTLTLANPPASDCRVLGDRELLTQLFVNLVENAINHGPPGTRIGLALDVDGNKVTATVRDTGPGIPLEERENVFRRLYRLDKSRSTPGSGLGLSLVQAIAELHMGEIQLSDNAPGLVVSLILPVVLPADF
ncbi:signal transduction histidine kinase [Pararhizobium capsulatum DSM 1112]|uniref:histidine kinase n=1 Tax=Pararhizobium capsulatum DSM 1112 TaxID=1121113 RepID=A0ABU0BNK2_9HYPH|nr:HAMP domain-containing sensor histidine kinase [Pararhizobium capsulatum]MDQ0318457.1 signal transduction histidine kinase [Pararhizobium capsulatum DSM 1112]